MFAINIENFKKLDTRRCLSIVYKKCCHEYEKNI